jgi:hypothetical protein
MGSDAVPGMLTRAAELPDTFPWLELCRNEQWKFQAHRMLIVYSAKSLVQCSALRNVLEVRPGT